MIPADCSALADRLSYYRIPQQKIGNIFLSIKKHVDLFLLSYPKNPYPPLLSLRKISKWIEPDSSVNTHLVISAFFYSRHMKTPITYQ